MLCVLPVPVGCWLVLAIRCHARFTSSGHVLGPRRRLHRQRLPAPARLCDEPHRDRERRAGDPRLHPVRQLHRDGRGPRRRGVPEPHLLLPTHHPGLQGVRREPVLDDDRVARTRHAGRPGAVGVVPVPAGDLRGREHGPAVYGNFDVQRHSGPSPPALGTARLHATPTRTV